MYIMHLLKFDNQTLIIYNSNRYKNREDFTKELARVVSPNHVLLTLCQTLLYSWIFKLFLKIPQDSFKPHRTNFLVLSFLFSGLKFVKVGFDTAKNTLRLVFGILVRILGLFEQLFTFSELISWQRCVSVGNSGLEPSFPGF